MRFYKEFIEDQFRGFETARDAGNNIVAVRVTKNGKIVSSWKVRDSRNLDAVLACAINIAIEHKIVSAREYEIG
jgi:hypothetical protein